MEPALDTLSDDLIIDRYRCLNNMLMTKVDAARKIKCLKHFVLHIPHVAQGVGHGGIEGEAGLDEAVGAEAVRNDLIQRPQDMTWDAHIQPGSDISR